MSAVTPAQALILQLLQLQRQHSTGLLAVVAEDVYTMLYFLQGRVVFADSTAVSETLGRLLLDDGVIDQAQYDHALEELTRLLRTNRDARLGGVLLNLGYATMRQVQEGIVQQTGRRIAHLMQFTEPAFTFTDGSEELRSVPRYPVRVEPFVLMGIRRFYDMPRLEAALAPYRRGYLMLRAEVTLIQRCFSLPPRHTRIVATVTGEQTADQWLAEQVGDFGLHILAALALTGTLAVSAVAPTRESVAEEATRNPSLAPPGNTGNFEIPRVTPLPNQSLAHVEVEPIEVEPIEVEPIDVEAADEPLERGREAIQVPVGRPAQPGRAIFTRREADGARRAPQVGRPPIRSTGRTIRGQPDAPEAQPTPEPPGASRQTMPFDFGPGSQQLPSLDQIERLEAETAARRGLELLAEDKYMLAQEQFAVAARNMPQIAEYRLYYVWAGHRLRGLDEAALIELEEASTLAARQDSRHGFPPYVSGYVALARGQDEMAQRYFKIACHRDPSNKDAAEKLAQVTAKLRKA